MHCLSLCRDGNEKQFSSTSFSGFSLNCLGCILIRGEANLDVQLIKKVNLDVHVCRNSIQYVGWPSRNLWRSGQFGVPFDYGLC